MVDLIVKSEGRAQTVEMKGSHYRIGRERGNDLVLSDPRLSRRHCEIRRRDDGTFVVEDKNSKNGTFVNGEKIDQVPLEEGDRIEIGDSYIYLGYRPDDEEEDEEYTAAGEDYGASKSHPETKGSAFHALNAASRDLTGLMRAAGIFLVVGFVVAFSIYVLLQSVGEDNKEANLLGSAGSFEAGTQSWRFGPGSSLEPVDQKNTTVLKLQLPGKNKRSYSNFSRSLSVNASSRYLFRGKFLAQNIKGVAGVLLNWKRERDESPFYQHLVLPVTGGKGIWKFRKTGWVSPPAGAQHLELRLLAVGTQGSFLVDHLFVKENSNTSGSRDSAEPLDPFPFKLDEHGQYFSKSKDKPRLLQSGLRVWENDRSVAPWMTKVIKNREKGTRVNWLGSVLSPDTFRNISFSLEVQKRNRLSFRYAFRRSILVRSDRIGFQFRLDTDRELRQIPVASEEKGEIEVRPAQLEEDVKWIVLPHQNDEYRFVFSQNMKFRYFNREEGTVVSLFVPSERLKPEKEIQPGIAKSSRNISLSLTLEKVGASERDRRTEKSVLSVEEMKHMIQSNQWGRALQAMSKTLSSSGIGERKRARIRRLQKDLLTRLEEQRLEISRGLETARQLNSSHLASRYFQQAGEVMERLGESPHRDKFKPLYSRGLRLNKTFSQNVKSEKARNMLNRLQTFVSAGKKDLARLLAKELTNNYPGTSASSEADKLLDSMD